MKILVIAPTPFFSDRGTHIRILEEALALEKLGHRITIATYHIGREISGEIETKIDVRRIHRLLFWYKKLEAGPDWQKIILDLMLIRKAFFLARTQKPDIIHGHLHEGVLVGWIVQKILFWRKMKLVADFHGSLTGEMLSHGYLKRGLKEVFQKVENFINQLGDSAIVSSWEGAENIKKSRADGKAEVVLDGTNLDSFAVKKSKAELRAGLKVPGGKFVVGYAGGLVPNKGIGYLFEAIKIVLKKRPDVFFLIGGFPAHPAEKFVRDNRLEKNLLLMSPLNYFKLPEFLLACDAAVDPKNSDTMQASGKMLNYMAAGLLIVCFDKPNNRKYLGDGGWFCQEMSAEKISEGILYSLDHPDEMKNKGEMNRKKAEEFSWRKSAEKIDRIYETIYNKQ